MNVDEARANNTVDGDCMPDTADATDADMFEIPAQIQTNGILDSASTGPNPEDEDILLAESESHLDTDLTATVPDPEQIPSAKSVLPPKNPSNMSPAVVL